MQLSIRARNVEVNDEIRELIERRTALALDTFRMRVESVNVYLMDLNGPRGGVDKLCQIAVRVSGAGHLNVLEKGPTVAASLSRALGRIKYRISETVKKTARPKTASIRTQPAAA